MSEVRSKHRTWICLSLCQARQGYDFPIPSSLKSQRCLPLMVDVHGTSAGGLCFSWSRRVPANRPTKISNITSPFTWKKMEVCRSQSSNSNAVAQMEQMSLLLTSHWLEGVTWANTRLTEITILQCTQEMESWKYLASVKMSSSLPKPMY